MKKIFKYGILLLTIFISLTYMNIDVDKITSLPTKSFVSTSDVASLNSENTFGKAVRISLSDIQTSAGEKTKAKMWVKLFGIIPIKQVEVELNSGAEVYLGGIPLGFSLQTKGLLVVGENSVDDNTLENSVIKKGDFLIKINNQEVNTSQDAKQILSSLPKNEEATLTYVRDNQILTCSVTPQIDNTSGENKLGLWVKTDANGVGTLTFVRTEDNRFGALGHPITDYETGVEIQVSTGKIYKCNQVGITKAEKNNPGELRCVFLQGINTKGTIDTNSQFGVFGNVTDVSSLVDYNRTSEIGSRLTIKHGKAKILSAVSGVLEDYDIEIIKTAYQPESDDKSMIFRVTDKRLLDLTGGIVQGMSGSPIIQNDKLVGAVTHVFLSDPTKGYGIYADWMADM